MTDLDKALIELGYKERVVRCVVNTRISHKTHYYIKNIDGVELTYIISESHNHIIDKYCLAHQPSDKLAELVAKQGKEYQELCKKLNLMIY